MGDVLVLTLAMSSGEYDGLCAVSSPVRGVLQRARWSPRWRVGEVRHVDEPCRQSRERSRPARSARGAHAGAERQRAHARRRRVACLPSTSQAGRPSSPVARGASVRQRPQRSSPLAATWWLRAAIRRLQMQSLGRWVPRRPGSVLTSLSRTQPRRACPSRSSDSEVSTSSSTMRAPTRRSARSSTRITAASPRRWRSMSGGRS
jgi:hypothetical protein